MDYNKNILVSCSSRKSNVKGVKSDLTSLSFHNELHQTRKYIIDRYLNGDCNFWDTKTNQKRNLCPSKSLDWGNCLPAYKRYTGIVYSHVEKCNWQKADNVLIISPLWGIIRPEDKIPHYNLQMSDLLISEKNHTETAIWRVWRPVLDDLLVKLSKNIPPYTLLFNNCSLAFGVNNRNTFESPIPNWNDNYGHHKGKWLNNYLSNK